MRVKRLTALLLCLCALLSLFGAASAAFPDLENHWAASFMTDLVNRGYLAGYNDGLMRPDEAITGAQALTLLSRFYGITGEDKTRLYEDYGPAAERYVTGGTSWARESAAICLAAGIVTETELSRFNLSAAIEKEYLAELLVRAMQMSEAASAQSDTQLTFTDTGEITLSRRPYIALLVRLGVIEGTDENTFRPHSSVTRAVAAKMISVSLDYMERTNSMPTIPAYTNAYSFAGVVTSYDGQIVQITSLEGETRQFTLETTTKRVLSGGEAVPALRGRYATAVANRDTHELLRLTVDASGALWTQGVYVSAVNTTANRTLTLTELGGSENTVLRVASDVTTTVDGAAADYTRITRGAFLSVCHDGTTANRIVAVNGTRTLHGTISAIDYGVVITLHLKAEDGAHICVRIDASNLPKITRGTTQLSIDRLHEGDTVDVYFARSVPESIEVSGQQANISGQLTAIATTMDGTTLTVVNDERSYTYLIETNIGVWQNETALTLADLRVGQQVSIVVYADRITEVYIESGASVAGESLTGSVLSVDTAARQLLVLTEGHVVYVQTKLGTPILSTGKGQTIVLANVTPGTTITAFGSYEGAVFQATSIIMP